MYDIFCYCGGVNPSEITQTLGLIPDDITYIGQELGAGRISREARWKYGQCCEYDVIVDKMMKKTLENLFKKIDILKEIKAKYDLTYFLEIVPEVYPNGINPCLAPGKEVIKFCYETDTEIDIDLYVYESLIDKKS